MERACFLLLLMSLGQVSQTNRVELSDGVRDPLLDGVQHGQVTQANRVESGDGVRQSIGAVLEVVVNHTKGYMVESKRRKKLSAEAEQGGGAAEQKRSERLVSGSGLTDAESVSTPLLATVDTYVPRLGTVRGIAGDALGVDRWLGIPFAAPPVGVNRWMPPTALEGWGPDGISEGEIDGTQFGASCLPHVGAATWMPPEPQISEDCLYLNVWAPGGHAAATAAGTAKTLPVVIFIHGGAFFMGSGANPATAPPPEAFVASAQVVFVTLNYRLGALGFMVSSALPSNGGLQGIQDQTEAMRWVHRNIGAFGGDPSRVTLQGASAGAISICLHLVMPSSQGLFTSAIIQSGMCSYPFEDISSAYAGKERLSRAVGCYKPLSEKLINASAGSGGLAVEHSAHEAALKAEEEQDGRHMQPVGPGAGVWDGMPMRLKSSSMNDGVWPMSWLKTLVQPATPAYSANASRDSVVQVYSNSSALPWHKRLWYKAKRVSRAAKAKAKRISMKIFRSLQNDTETDISSLATRRKYTPPVWEEHQMQRDVEELECLRLKAGPELTKAMNARRGLFFYEGEQWGPVVDGVVLPDHPLRMLETGLANVSGMDILYGHNKDEASVFVLFAWPLLVSEPLVWDLLNATLGQENAEKVWLTYIRGIVAPEVLQAAPSTVKPMPTGEQPAPDKGPIPGTNDPLRIRTVRLLNDMWRCASFHAASLLATHGARVRLYEFSHTPSYLSDWFKWLGAFHGAELDFVMGAFSAHDPLPEETRLSAHMSRLWAEFVTGRRLRLPSNKDGAEDRNITLIEDPDLPADPSPLSVGEQDYSGVIVGRAKRWMSRLSGSSAQTNASRFIPEVHVDPSAVHVNDVEWPLFAPPGRDGDKGSGSRTRKALFERVAAGQNDGMCLLLLAEPTFALSPRSTCRPAECVLWDATLGHGLLLRMPPQMPEPLFSRVINVWAPRALQWLSHRLSHLNMGLLFITLLIGGAGLHTARARLLETIANAPSVVVRNGGGRGQGVSPTNYSVPQRAASLGRRRASPGRSAAELRHRGRVTKQSDAARIAKPHNKYPAVGHASVTVKLTLMLLWISNTVRRFIASYFHTLFVICIGSWRRPVPRTSPNLNFELTVPTAA